MKIDVIATTISGSISDWKKIEQIKPLFADHGFNDVVLHSCDSHSEARQIACNSLLAGGRRPISAGGSGTFRAVMEGCLDSGVPMDEIRLGFLRKGSADLIGKVLKMPTILTMQFLFLQLHLIMIPIWTQTSCLPNAHLQILRKNISSDMVVLDCLVVFPTSQKIDI